MSEQLAGPSHSHCRRASAMVESSDYHGNGDNEEEAAFADLPEPLRLTPASLLTRYSGQINVLAPLVRCSKLPFRHLCSLYETHVTHTPMILAEEFSRSQTARVSDFSSSVNERGMFWLEPVPTAAGQVTPPPPPPPLSASASASKSRTNRLPPSASRLSGELVRGLLIAQLASPNAASLADASYLMSPYVDGVDINCGCPQKWAFHEGIGCALLRKPDLVADMIRVTKDRLGWEYPVSIKIRIDPEPHRTDTLVRNAIAMGVSHITIHGRTRHQPSTDPVNLPGLQHAVECVGGRVPTVANGDLWTLEDAAKMRATGVDGVMAARGLLANPALFAGYDRTPKHAVEQFINLSLDYGFIYPLFQKHLAYMLESRLSKPQRVFFNSLSSPVASIEYLSQSKLAGIDIVSGRNTIWDARRGRNLLAQSFSS